MAGVAEWRVLAREGIRCRPDELRVLERARSGDAAARALIERWSRAREDADALARRLELVNEGKDVVYRSDVGEGEAFDHFAAYQPAVTEHRWKRSRSTFWVEGVRLEVEGAREVVSGWSQSPKRFAERLRTCGHAWTTAIDRAGKPFAAPLGCDASLCPRCLGQRAGHRVRDWLPLLRVLRASGCVVLHVTLTRPSEPSGPHPVVLTDREAARFAGDFRRATRRGRAMPGDPLAWGLLQLSDAWTAIADNRTSRDWWKGSVAGSVVGREWTSRRQAEGEGGLLWDEVPTAGSYGKPWWWFRWHVHQHALVVLRPGADAEMQWSSRTLRGMGREAADYVRTSCTGGGWWDRLVSEWCSLVPGAQPAGQKCVRVEDDESALCEVLKYSFKPTEVTSAQAAEAIAAAGGLHLHQAGGMWHGSSNIAKAAKAGAWGHLDDEDQRLAKMLREGYDARDEERRARCCELLFRAQTHASRHARVIPELEGANRNAKFVVTADDFIPATPEEVRHWDVGERLRPEGRRVVPATVRYLAHQASREPRGGERMWSYDTESRAWKDRGVVAWADVLAVVTNSQPSAS